MAPRTVVLACFGSLGDVNPYVAIGVALRATGHRALVATSERWRSVVLDAGLEFRPTRPDLPGTDQDEEMARLAESAMDERWGSLNVLDRLVLPFVAESHEDLLGAARGADLLVTHPLVLAGPPVAAQLRIPWASTVLAPASFFSATDPPVNPDASVLDWALARSPALFRGARRLLALWLRRRCRPVDDLRRRLGLAPGGHPLFEGQHAPGLVLALFSGALASPQPDWPPQTLLTGFPFPAPGSGVAALPGPVAAFLDQGPPIVVSFGSTGIWVARALHQAAAEAARALGQRALLLAGPARNLPPGPLPEGVLAAELAPHEQVFPGARVVVHHGGVGTVAQALRASVPQLIVPLAHDQFDNARRVERLGCGRTLPRRSCTTAALTRALAELLADDGCRRAALREGERVRAEDGAGAACAALERLLGATSTGA